MTADNIDDPEVALYFNTDDVPGLTGRSHRPGVRAARVPDPSSTDRRVAMAELASPRVVLVTGAADGIGRAACLAFAAEGDTIVVNDLLEDATA